MTFTRPWKIVIGIVTFLVAIFPLIIMGIYFSFFFSMISQISNYESYGPSYSDFDPTFFNSFFLLFPVMMCLGILQFIMTIFYIIVVINNDAGSRILRTLCGLGFYFLPWIAMPAYFLMYIAPNKVPAWALEAGVQPARKRK
jgi:hypothetical protein